MKTVLSDAVSTAPRWFEGPLTGSASCSPRDIDPAVGAVAAAVFRRTSAGGPPAFEHGDLVRLEMPTWNPPCRFRTLLLADRAERSNLDVLTELLRRNMPVPDGLVCASVRGRGFLGRFDRTWRAMEGNLHTVIHLAPSIEVRGAGAAFPVLSAVAVAEATARLAPEGDPPAVKWVNDLFLDGRKVGGVLTRQSCQGSLITNVLLGIGVNLRADPRLPPNPFVPATGCLAELRPGGTWSPAAFLQVLLERIEHWYTRLLRRGPAALLDAYRRHAGFIGRRVRVFEDRYGFEEGGTAGRRLLARGRVTGVADDLSLLIEGCPEPVRSGRMAYEEDGLSGISP